MDDGNGMLHDDDDDDNNQSSSHAPLKPCTPQAKYPSSKPSSSHAPLKQTLLKPCILEGGGGGGGGLEDQT